MTRSINKWALLALLVVLAMMHGSSARAEDELMGLQEIVDQANPGATLVLKPGTYQGPVVVNKPLTIRTEGEGNVELMNTSRLPALTIDADGITVTGLHITDGMVKETPTVLVRGHRAVLNGLYIRTGGDGIAVRDADEGLVTNTTIDWAAEGVRLADKGNGVDVFNGHRWRFMDNTIRDVHDGIYLENSDDTRVTGNRIERSRYGIHCMYTNRTVIEQNEGSLNVTGAMVMTARQVSVIGNSFSKQSENVNSQGILLYDTHDSILADNTVDGNRVGLYVELSTGNRLENNEVRYNFVGIQLLDSSSNSIAHNRFTGNVADAQARSSEDNRIIENYWDNFRGIDANGDGNSDISYAINPLFQELTKKRPAFQLFFQSPGMVFLEGLYQSDRDRWTTDAAPLMTPPMSENQIGDAEGRTLTGIAGLVLLGCTGTLFFWMRRRMS